ncbi:MAG: TssQ family T6SS-associated lipoprotein [Burkholderiaceae bacterium]|jgi:hypothetical protein|nr:TssQ family T6SS-associated lipoprotein [Burkholderiaceae bacterium]
MKIPALLQFMAAAGIAISLAACQTPSDKSDQNQPTPPASAASAAASVPTENVQPQQANQQQADPQLPPNPGSFKHSIVAERTFEAGVNLYENGQYNEALKKFQAPEISLAGRRLRVQALKYSAFSYCVQNKLLACQKAFHDALRIDPQFKLKPSESSHPIWGPVFKKAQSGQS